MHHFSERLPRGKAEYRNKSQARQDIFLLSASPVQPLRTVTDLVHIVLISHSSNAMHDPLSFAANLPK